MRESYRRYADRMHMSVLTDAIFGSGPAILRVRLILGVVQRAISFA
jgi:hypothetical protein